MQRFGYEIHFEFFVSDRVEFRDTFLTIHWLIGTLLNWNISEPELVQLIRGSLSIEKSPEMTQPKIQCFELHRSLERSLHAISNWNQWLV